MNGRTTIAGRQAAAAVVGIAIVMFSFPSAAEDATRPARRGGVEAAELEAAVENVIAQPEYAWRLPRSRPDTLPLAERESIFWSFLRNVQDLVRRVWRTLSRWIDRFFEWLEERFRPRAQRERTPVGWTSSIRLLLFILLAGTLSVLGIVLYRVRRRRRPVRVAAATTLRPSAELLEENAPADALPADEWLQLARDLWRQGRTRHALRALFLSCLSHLGQRRLIAIATHKSNRDYLREVRRRAPDAPDLAPVFASNVRIIESVWYGLHTPDDATIAAFTTNHARMTGQGLDAPDGGSGEDHEDH